MRHGAHVPDVVKDVAGVADQKRGQFAVVIPGAGDGAFVDSFGFFVEEKRDRRNVRLRAVEANVALALLLGIVKGMRVKERPDELAADVFEAKFEMRVLVDGVVAAVKRGGADIEALLVGDFFGGDQAGRITGARSGNSGIERVRESVAERDARRGGFDKFAGTRAVKHARLGSHVGRLFYTRGQEKEVESQKLHGKKEDNAHNRMGLILRWRTLQEKVRKNETRNSAEEAWRRQGEFRVSDFGFRASGYFLAAPALEAASAYFLVKRSTRPAVSTSFCLPVKNGWQLEQISTRSISPFMVERVGNVFPQAQWTVTE